MTTRQGGVSSGPYASLNSSCTWDDSGAVLENRRRAAAALGAGLGDFVFASRPTAACAIVTAADRGRAR